MKIAAKIDDRNKIEESLFKYEFIVGGEKLYFYFKLMEHAAFMRTRASGLEELVSDAIDREPREQHFEYTGSRFEPLTNRSWINLNWKGSLK